MATVLPRSNKIRMHHINGDFRGSGPPLPHFWQAALYFPQVIMMAIEEVHRHLQNAPSPSPEDISEPYVVAVFRNRPAPKNGSKTLMCAKNYLMTPFLM